MAFVGGLLFVVFGFVIGCEVVQPLIDNAGVGEPVEEVKEVEEYFLVKPGIGLEYRTIDMNESVQINLNDDFDDVISNYPEDNLEISFRHTYINNDIVDRIHFLVHNGRKIKRINVYNPKWTVDGETIIGKMRTEVNETYGARIQRPNEQDWTSKIVGHSYVYENLGFVIGFNAYDNEPTDRVTVIGVFIPE